MDEGEAIVQNRNAKLNGADLPARPSASPDVVTLFSETKGPKYSEARSEGCHRSKNVFLINNAVANGETVLNLYFICFFRLKQSF